jgi:hypothetical protein
MAESPFRYEIAISFRFQDLARAEQLRVLLEPALRTFVYARKQEEIALNDGMDAFRQVFKEEAMISLILHRDGWGDTPWTGVEQAAIRDRCLKTKFKSLAVVKLDDSPLPAWVPDTHIAFDSQAYPVEQLVGAIKARAQSDFSVKLAPPSALARAKLALAQAQFDEETEAYLRSPDGLAAIRKSIDDVFARFSESLQGLAPKLASLELKCGSHNGQAVARLGAASGQFRSEAAYVNKPPSLTFTLWEGGLPMDWLGEYAFEPPRKASKFRFLPTRTPALGVAWLIEGQELPMTAQQVADEAAAELVDIALRMANSRR